MLQRRDTRGTAVISRLPPAGRCCSSPWAPLTQGQPHAEHTKHPPERSGAQGSHLGRPLWWTVVFVLSKDIRVCKIYDLFNWKGWKQVFVFGKCWQWEHPVTVAFPPLLLPLHKLGGKKRCLFIPMNSQTEPRSCWPPCKHKRVPQGRTSPTDFISNKHLFPSPCKLHVHLKVILPVVSLSHYPDSEGHLPPFHLTPATGEPTRQHRNSGAVTVLLLLPGQAQNCRAAYQIKMLWIGREITSTPGV